MASVYQAKYDFSSKSDGMLSFRSGDQFTVKNRTNDDWWTVEDRRGEMGLVPVTYIEPIPQGQEYSDGGSGSVAEGVFTALYDFTGQDSSQLTFKQGDQLTLLAKTDVQWWTMRSPNGNTGIVPLNYINISPASGPAAANTTTTTAASSTAGSHSNHKPHPQNGEEGEALTEVLLSIDRAMEKIHDEATLQGGFYNPQQKIALQQLAAHRKAVVEDSATHVTNHSSLPNSPSHTSTHTNSTPSPSLRKTGNSTSQIRGSQTVTDGQSPRPKRKAPAPPSNTAASQKGDSPRKSRNLRSSREDLLSGYQSQTLPTRDRSKGGKSGSHSQNYTGMQQQQQQQQQQQGHRNRTQTAGAPLSSSPRKSKQRRSSENLLNGDQTSMSSFSPSTFSTQQSQSPSKKAPVGRSKSVNVQTLPASFSPSSSPSHPHGVTSGPPPSVTKDEGETTKISLPPGLSPRSSPSSQRRLVSVPDHSPPSLPTQFPSSDGAELIEVVRARTHLSYGKSVQAVSGLLELLKEMVPQCEAMMDGLLSAVQKSYANTSPSTSRKVKDSADLERLKEIFFQLQDVRDDSQQRGWAVHDDLKVIMDYLSELLQILCDADPEVTKAAVQEDKYENILTLISYYDTESRIPIRLLMLQVFGVLCGLDKEIINILLGSILPNELGRDIHNHLTEVEKTLFSCTVCTMIFSTGEAVPLTIYDQWSESYISFLMDTIESPPEEDTQDQIPDAFLNVILSFNQHFTDPETNLVMRVLKTKKDPRHFSEKFMFLINRGEDPVALQEPACPDSLTKFALDVFSSEETSGMFYTTDFMVLIDIVLRQISDLCPGDKIRSHYLELLYRIVNTTDYQSHNHRQKEITAVLNRIMQEEGGESAEDHDIIKKLWLEHSGCFDEITDV